MIVSVPALAKVELPDTVPPTLNVPPVLFVTVPLIAPPEAFTVPVAVLVKPPVVVTVPPVALNVPAFDTVDEETVPALLTMPLAELATLPLNVPVAVLVKVPALALPFDWMLPVQVPLLVMVPPPLLATMLSLYAAPALLVTAPRYW